jgi:hypothetical protein
MWYFEYSYQSKLAECEREKAVLAQFKADVRKLSGGAMSE